VREADGVMVFGAAVPRRCVGAAPGSGPGARLGAVCATALPQL